MGDIAVRVENLSKLYRIGAKQESYRTFRDSITDALTAPFKRIGGLLRGNAAAAANLNETIWALKDVSFEVKKGEVVGFIGRNGAGKSTLLKILSRITEPTSGEAKVYGRVGALLEVGTGFHPELTGRENIYLNGAILGMSRETIKRKFDEIVAFAEVEKFIDTPVKHYSSGMGLRLGFAVAAHLEPEILIVDEVLAVGDAAFQKKCLGKMSDVAGEGRTVLFVSHNMAAVSQLCERAIVLEKGLLYLDGEVVTTVSTYLRSLSLSGLRLQAQTKDTQRNKSSSINRVQILDDLGNPISVIKTYGTLRIQVECTLVGESNKNYSIGIVINDMSGGVVSASHLNQYVHYKAYTTTQTLFEATIRNLPLNPSVYSLSVYLSNDRSDYEKISDASIFEVVWDEHLELKYPPLSNWGNLFIPVQWKVLV